MIQFNRADERRPYFFFQKTTGNLTDKSVDTKLIDGVSVPMEIFVTTYSTVKIYDSLPPLAYLIELIWTNVVLPRASDTSKFPALRKNQKIEVTLSVDDIVNELHNGFSFHGLSKDIADRQPKVPKREWIMSACEKLVQSDEASWVDTEKSQIKVYFRKYDSVMSHFIDICADEQEEDAQITMFD
jgi:hypothetical protein